MRILGPTLLALALLLSGCGASSSEATDRPTSGPESAGPLTVAIVSQTAAGGEVDLDAVPSDDEAAWQDFTAQFEGGSLPRKISDAVGSATVPEGYAVWAAVVAIGCDVPTGVAISESADGWVLDPQLPSETMMECFAPVTSVAVVAVPA